MRWLLDGLEGQRFRAIAAGQAGDRYPGRIACSLRKRDDALWENSGKHGSCQSRNPRIRSKSAAQRCTI